MSLAVMTAGIILASLTFYVLLGGADYGAGVWKLLARGSRGPAQRRLIEEAIGPIWEANHVWLILVITVLFTAFPAAFAVITTRLHIPLTLMLVGIVLRGAGFAFRGHDVPKHLMHPFWERTFAIASVITPVLLGVTIGTIASGELRENDGAFLSEFIWPWLAPFPLTVGVLALALFVFLAAVYLTREAKDAELREDFRRRALVAAVMVALSARGAPQIWRELTRTVWGLSLLLVTAVVAGGAILALSKRRFLLAQICAAGEAVLVLWGWAFAQFPFLVIPNITIFSAAASQQTLGWLLLTTAAGAVVLFPSLYYLFRVFKARSLSFH